MGFGSFLQSIGDVIATGIRDVANAGNVVDRYTNPFHVENVDASPSDTGNKSNFLGLVNTQPLANAVINHAVMPSVETAGQAIDWAFSNGISHPISTVLLEGKLARDQGGLSGNPGAFFSAANWSAAWRASQHVAPGQALFLSDSQGASAVNSPLEYYTPAASMLPPGFTQLPHDQQQEILKNAGMPAVGNAYVENVRREEPWFKYASGIADFALHWEADPTVLAGKVASAVRAARVIKVRPVTGWSAEDIDKMMANSTMAKAQQYIYDNRANPQLLNNLQMAKESALGPRFGAIASTLQSPAEVSDFLRVGLGDVSAIERLSATNAAAGARIAQDTSRFSALDLMRTRYIDAAQPQMVRLISDQMDQLNKGINADQALVDRYGQVLDHADELDKVNLSRWSFARAEQRTEAQNLYRTGPAVGGGALRERLPQGMQHAVVENGSARYISTPLAGGLVKSRIYGAGDFFSTPITLVRSLKEMTPNGYMRIDDINQDSVNELRGQLARIPGITATHRQQIMNDYLQTTTEGDRLRLLNEVGALGAAKVAAKHGMSAQDGLDIYKASLERQQGEAENARRYSAASRTIDTPGGPRQIRVDEFMDDGGKLVVHPNLVTRLANDHVLQDLGALDTVLSRYASPLRAIRMSRAGNPDWLKDAADYTTHLFKFGTLFRLGYIPRVLGDDVAGQWARAGAVAMASRIGWGVRNGATNAARALAKPFNEAAEQAARQGVGYAESEMAHVQEQMDAISPQVVGRQQSNALDLSRAQQRLAAAQARWDNLPATATAAQRGAVNRLIFKRQSETSAAHLALQVTGSPGQVLEDLQTQHAFLKAQRDAALQKAEFHAAQQQKIIQGSRSIMINGKTFPAAFEGPGQLYQALLSPDEALGNIFATNKQLIHGNLMRSYDHGARVIRPSENEDLHARSWAHAASNQLGQDQLGRLAIQGSTPEEMTKWLTNTPAGRAYRKRLGITFTTAEDLAQSVWHDAAEYLPTPEIRQAVLDGTLTPGFLKEAVPNMADRPEVHTGLVGVQGQLKLKRALDRVVQSWFKVASSIPAERMSRHPLFNQLYEGHVKTLVNQRDLQGGMTVSDVDGITQAARRLALRDTRKLVFDIAHRTDAAAALRFISPFYSATAEAFQRWGRIIADKPQVVGYAADFFNAPAALGHMQDKDGNTVMRDGTVIDPTTGQRTLVPKSERYIVARMPSWLVDSPLGRILGVERSSGNMTLSQNSLNLVTQGDPWFHPGVGPIVSIPVNELVKDKPHEAEIARTLGILPFGPSTGSALVGNSIVGRAADQMMPSTIKNFLTAFDTSDTRYQQVKLQIMQRAAYEHDNLGKPMPSAQRVADMTRNYWLFTAASAFLQPASTQRKDAYQFYRDQYNNLLRKDPLTADSQFLDKFGESYFVFAQSQSKNAGGVQATQKAVALTKQYGDLIAANPELAALIVGPEGNGPFSPEAYVYQLTTPLIPGGSEMQRTKLSAEQAMQENQRRLGWAKYTAKMNQLTAQLHDRGLKSFQEDGAQDLLTQKQAWTNLYSQPLYPDGTSNPYYNAAWSKDWFSLDPVKYERLIPGLTTLANSPLASQPQRSDLRVLQEYLGGRKQMLGMLQQRFADGGAKTLTAKANSDLATAWAQFTDGLISSDTRFGDLVHRYLARDLGVDSWAQAVANGQSDQGAAA